MSYTVKNGTLSGDTYLVPMEEAKKYDLPDEFTIVPATALKKVNVSIPDPPNVIEAIKGNLSGAKAQETCWLDHAIKLLEKEQVEDKNAIAWSAYHASQENPSDDVQPALTTQFLPLFYEKVATATMIKHGMDMLKKATQFLNPGQISVVALDAPLFPIAKLVQWNWPQTHGEEDFVVMFGGLISKWLYGRHLETL